MTKQEILKKAEKRIEEKKIEVSKIKEDENYYKICLEALICPRCGEDITFRSRPFERISYSYRCSDCNGLWQI